MALLKNPGIQSSLLDVANSMPEGPIRGRLLDLSKRRVAAGGATTNKESPKLLLLTHKELAKVSSIRLKS